MVNDPSAIACGTTPGNLTAQPPPLHYSLIQFTAARKVLQHVDIVDIRHLNSFPLCFDSFKMVSYLREPA